MIELDITDRKILKLLQANGQLSNLELAQAVNLSPSPCLRRVKRLEEAGVISRYVALLHAPAVGLGLRAFVNVRLEKYGSAAPGKAPADVFRAAVATWPEVTACYAMTGEMDYLLEVVVADMAHFSRFIQDDILRHPAVIDVRSSFALDCIKATTELPL